MLNVHNAEEAFNYQKKFVESRIRELKEEQKITLHSWIEKGLNMIEIEDDLVERGLIKLGDCDLNWSNGEHFDQKAISSESDKKANMFKLSDEEEVCMRMTRRVMRRCNELLKFNQERQDSKQNDLCRKEIQNTVSIWYSLKRIMDIVTNSDNDIAVEAAKASEIDIDKLDDIRLQRKIHRIKCD
jgi:hypothetical protein